MATVKRKRRRGIIYQLLQFAAVAGLLTLFFGFYLAYGFEVFASMMSLAFISVSVLGMFGE